MPAAAIRPSGVVPVPVRVLVVDDDDDSRELLGILLERHGYVVRGAASGGVAVEVAAEFVPAVVLADIGLPDFDGFELARRLGEQPALKACRLVAVTGHAGPEVEHRIKQAGFASYVRKPISLEAVIAAVGGESAAVMG